MKVEVADRGGSSLSKRTNGGDAFACLERYIKTVWSRYNGFLTNLKLPGTGTRKSMAKTQSLTLEMAYGYV